ncbi:MAG: hypothetical protein CYPHOPRED_003899 [Cyphobasidiales sp. Tagirdzhanova-0007]|nr:MAG: hypothetical protein CYPHOPRED_003899 [Cyphobasidiales sp. Tagirdzhanova-0007]
MSVTDSTSSSARSSGGSNAPSLTDITDSSAMSPPSTPHSHFQASRLSQESLTSLYHADDRYTQLPLLSPRERRSSSVNASAVKRKRSFASLAAAASRPSSSGGSFTHGRKNSASASVILEGRRLRREYVEASRKSAKEALDEDIRALDSAGQDNAMASRSDEYALDCYFTSLDYLLRAVKLDPTNAITSKAIRARLEATANSFRNLDDDILAYEGRHTEPLPKHTLAAADQAPPSVSKRLEPIHVNGYDAALLLLAFLAPVALLPHRNIRIAWVIVLSIGIMVMRPFRCSSDPTGRAVPLK